MQFLVLLLSSQLLSFPPVVSLLTVLRYEVCQLRLLVPLPPLVPQLLQLLIHSPSGRFILVESLNPVLYFLPQVVLVLLVTRTVIPLVELLLLKWESW